MCLSNVVTAVLMSSLGAGALLSLTPIIECSCIKTERVWVFNAEGDGHDARSRFACFITLAIGVLVVMVWRHRCTGLGSMVIVQTKYACIKLDDRCLRISSGEMAFFSGRSRAGYLTRSQGAHKRGDGFIGIGLFFKYCADLICSWFLFTFPGKSLWWPSFVAVLSLVSF